MKKIDWESELAGIGWAIGFGLACAAVMIAVLLGVYLWIR